MHSKTVEFWESELHLLKMFPLPEVQRVLEDSFNDLSDEERQVFLDITHFFIGMNQNDVLETLNRSTQCTTLQISLLEDKSLVIIDENNNLQMHVLLQSMARDVIRRESSNKTDQVSGIMCVCVRARAHDFEVRSILCITNVWFFGSKICNGKGSKVNIHNIN